MKADDQMARLDAVREKIDEVSQKRMRLEGQVDEHRRRMAELEQRSKDEFGVEVGELKALATTLMKEAEDALREAEKVLGMGCEDE